MNMREIIRIVESFDFGKNFYHGTARDGGTFRADRVAYFTPNFDEAAEHARMDGSTDGEEPYVICVQLLVKKPIKIDRIEMQDLHSNPEKVQELLSHGYDSAIHDGEDEICVLRPELIRIKRIKKVSPYE